MAGGEELPSAGRRMEQANDAYRSGAYEEAIEAYEALLSEGYRSEALYFNLGNSYYRVGELGRGVLNYERAARLDPADPDVRHNLSVLRSKLEDDLEVLPAFFLARWWTGLRRMLSPSGWSILAILMSWAGVAGLVVWRLGQSRRQRKLGFVAGLSMLFLSFLPYALAASGQAVLADSGRAVIMEQEAVLRSAPDSLSKNIRQLHEGTTVELLDAIGEWHKVRLANGEEGWLPEEVVERI